MNRAKGLSNHIARIGSSLPLLFLYRRKMDFNTLLPRGTSEAITTGPTWGFELTTSTIERSV